jgi:predicted DNA-binding transcriptional regulator YafY
MDRTERFYRIDRLLREQRLVTLAQMMEALEVSRATLKRDLEYMRSRLHAPIVWDHGANGYRLNDATQGGGRYELPGLWFSPAEIHALLTLHQLVAGAATGSVLAPHVAPLRARLEKLLGAGEHEAAEVGRRVRILDLAARTLAPEHFQTVGSAVLRRRRLDIDYYVRSRDQSARRTISPQRLVHYRDNWYVDAWCHLRNDVRSFSVDAIRSAVMLDEPAREVDDATLDRILGSGYGIFSGAQVEWATLRFTAERARWVATERWHPQQRSRYEPDGSYVLELAYSDPRELVMDILRHGPEVEVVAPRSLRDEVLRQIRTTLQRYGQT